MRRPGVSPPTSSTPAAQAPEGCTTVSIVASSEKAALLGTLAEKYNGSSPPVDGDLHVDDGVHEGQRRRRDGAGPRLGREGRRPDSRRLEPGVELVGRAGRPGVHRPRPPQPDAQGAPVPGADPAGHRDAAAHGPGPGLAGRADRLEGPRRDREVAEGLGEQGPSRVGPLQARQDQPVLLDLRAERDDRVLLRGDRRLQRPHVRAGRRPGDPGVRQAAGVLRRPLRRHDVDLPGEHEPGGGRGAGPDLRLGGHGRGEVRPGLQPRQPDREPRDPGPAAAADRPPGGGVPLGWHPALGQPVDRAGRRRGSTTRSVRPPRTSSAGCTSPSSRRSSPTPASGPSRASRVRRSRRPTGCCPPGRPTSSRRPPRRCWPTCRSPGTSCASARTCCS